MFTDEGLLKNTFTSFIKLDCLAIDDEYFLYIIASSDSAKQYIDEFIKSTKKYAMVATEVSAHDRCTQLYEMIPILEKNKTSDGSIYIVLQCVAKQARAILQNIYKLYVYKTDKQCAHTGKDEFGVVLSMVQK